MTSSRYFRIESDGDPAVIVLTEPRLHGDVIGEVLRIELNQLVRDTRPNRLIIDFQNVTMISSSVISALVSVKKSLEEWGASLVLRAMAPPIRDVWQTLRLEGTVFDIQDVD